MENKVEDKKTNNSVNGIKSKMFCFSGKSCSSGCFLRKNFLGILLVLLGVFYLGRNVGWWRFNLDWTIFWPVFLVSLGLIMMFRLNRK